MYFSLLFRNLTTDVTYIRATATLANGVTSVDDFDNDFMSINANN